MSVTPIQLAYRDPFRIARRREANERHGPTFIVNVSQIAGQASGLGEAFPESYYGENESTVPAVLPGLLEASQSRGELRSHAPEEALASLELMSAAMNGYLGGHGAAKAGIDIALHDAAARLLGIPLHALFGLTPDVPPTDISLGIDEPDVVAQRAIRVRHFPAIKVKLGGKRDLETLEAVRSVYTGAIRVDANTGWTPQEGARLIPTLARYGVEVIEQPFGRQQLAQLRWLQERSPIPIIADESAVTIDDLDGLNGAVAGINVKLVKCGGVGPAYRMLQRARQLGLKTMIGCMGETSVGIGAAAALSSLADWVDLDSSLLLAFDPYCGIELDSQCRWRLSPEPGLGVSPRPPAVNG